MNSSLLLALLFSILLLASSLLAQTAAAPPNGSPEQLQDYCLQISSGVEHADVLNRFCDWATSLRQTIPNFMGEQSTHRTVQVEHNLYRDLGLVTAKVAYEDGKVRYSDIKVNKQPFNGSMDEIHGAWSKGEFGQEIVSLFLINQPAAYRFIKVEKREHKEVYLYEMRVKADDNRSWQMSFGPVDNRRFANPAFVARFWLLSSNAQILHLERETTEMPKDFPIRWSIKSSDYANTELGDGTRFVLPTSDTTVICNLGKGMACSKNELQFSHWHKFTATHRILPDTPAPDEK